MASSLMQRHLPTQANNPETYNHYPHQNNIIPQRLKLKTNRRHIKANSLAQIIKQHTTATLNPLVNITNQAFQDLSSTKKIINSCNLHEQNAYHQQILIQGQIQSANLNLQSKLNLKIVDDTAESEDIDIEARLDQVQHKLKVHLQIIQSMNILVGNRNLMQPLERPSELTFLLYKKYSLQRMKVLNFLKKYPMPNPFLIQHAKISYQQLIILIKSPRNTLLKAKLQAQNRQIKTKLNQLYNEFRKEQVGQRINMFDHDNFSKWIVGQLWVLFIFTQVQVQQSCEPALINQKLALILQMLFLVEQLRGNWYLSFANGEKALKLKQYREYIKIGKFRFEKSVLYKLQVSNP